ncbi:MAG TPA: F0F1 ATP synthase subunit B [Gemmatimonadaceae bacterium]|nr:F0F1 ATP synthase subunit B [Gemmatimonadaceae bacterium]
MRTLMLSFALILGNAATLFAQEAEKTPPLVALRLNLMLWTLGIFLVLYWMLNKWAFPAIFGAVEKREKALEDALASAKRDREESHKLLDDQRRQIESARGEAQKLIADGRAVAEKMRADMLEQTRQEQQALLERARRDIDTEKEKAVAQLRREAVNLAIAGASKVIEQNLDNTKNRELVEGFLSTLPAMTTSGR